MQGFDLKMVAGFCLLGLAACTHHDQDDTVYRAYGYLTPGPSSIPELIGEYHDEADCAAAADEWTTRQVVGNPIYAECRKDSKN